MRNPKWTRDEIILTLYFYHSHYPKIPEKGSQQILDNIISNILKGVDKRFLIIIGPCSIHKYKDAIDYAKLLSTIQKKYQDKIYFVMRCYVEKPRSTGLWTGYLNDPDLNGTNDIEKGILLNKQSNDASIPVIYGTRMIGGTRCFMESSGATNTYLYMALVMCEGEINDITSIKIDDKTVTWSGDLADATQVTVNTSDGNFYKDSTSLSTVGPH